MIIRATTTPGLEDIALAEGRRLLALGGFRTIADDGDGGGAEPFALAGVVAWRLSDEHGWAGFGGRNPLARARSLYHVAVHVAELEWDGVSLESLVDAIAGVDLPEMACAGSFRVSCSRLGEHGFQSPDVERSAGAVLQERYRTAVDLERFTLHVKIDIVERRAFAGYQLTRRKGLDRRYRWVYHPRVTLRTPIAYGMLVLSGYAGRPGALHDPFCGSGTILLEAAGVARESGVDAPPISGSDWDVNAVAGARANLDAEALGRICVSRLDARDLLRVCSAGSLDYIVTNPPFGIRMGRNANLLSMYRDFLPAAARCLRPGGTLALLVGRRRGAFNKVLEGFPEFTIEHVRVVEMGGVYAGLFVLRRTASQDRFVDPATKSE